MSPQRKKTRKKASGPAASPAPQRRRRKPVARGAVPVPVARADPQSPAPALDGADTEAAAPPATSRITIAGLGASAGGLEAVAEILREIGEAPGMALAPCPAPR